MSIFNKKNKKLWSSVLMLSLAVSASAITTGCVINQTVKNSATNKIDTSINNQAYHNWYKPYFDPSFETPWHLGDYSSSARNPAAYFNRQGLVTLIRDKLNDPTNPFVLKPNEANTAVVEKLMQIIADDIANPYNGKPCNSMIFEEFWDPAWVGTSNFYKVYMGFDSPSDYLNITNVSLNPSTETLSFNISLKWVPLKMRNSDLCTVWIPPQEYKWLCGPHAGDVSNIQVTVDNVLVASNKPKYNTNVSNNATINWQATLAQSIDKGYWKLNLMQDLINKNFIQNPQYMSKITINDFDLQPNPLTTNNLSCNNSTGELYSKIVFSPGKYFVAAEPNTTTCELPMTINGFWKIPKSEPIPNLIIKDTINQNNFANNITIAQVQQFVNQQSIKTFVNNPIVLNDWTTDQKNNNPWVNEDTKLEVVGLTPDFLNGLILVDAKIYNYSDEFHIIQDQGLDYQFTINGYFNTVNNNDLFNTYVPINLEISANNILAQDYRQNYTTDKTTTDLIKQALVNEIKNINLATSSSVSLLDSIEIVDVNGFNNYKGSIDLTFKIKNNYYLENGKVNNAKTFNLTVFGFKKIKSTIIEPIFKLQNRSHIEAKQYDQKLLDQDFKSNQNKIVKYLPDNALVSAKLDKTKVDNVNGSVTANIIVSEYFDSDKFGTLVKKNKIATCELYGFSCKYDGEIQYSTVVKSTELENINDIYVSDLIDLDSFLINNPTNLQRVLSAIANSQAISWPANNQTITVDDISIVDPIVDYNNKLGQITCRIKIINDKAWVNQVIKNPYISAEVNFCGFKPQIPTSVATNDLNVGSYLDWANKIPEQILNSDLKQFIQTELNQIYNGLPKDTNVIIKGIDRSQQANGIVKVTINVDKTYEQNQAKLIHSSSLADQVITLTGFKNSASDTTTFNGAIDLDLGDYVYSDVLDPNKEMSIKEKIIDELVANQNKYFSYLVTNQKLTRNDIDITFNKDPAVIDNTTGLLYIDNITIVNNKAKQANITQNKLQVNKKPVTVSLLKVQLPTRWTQQVPIVLSQAENYYPQAVVANNNKILEELIQLNRNSIIFNSVKNLPIKIVSAKINATNDGILATIAVDQFYNNKGILTANNSFTLAVEFRGFKSWTSDSNTLWKLDYIRWDNSLFFKLFGDYNGFADEWANPKNNWQFAEHFTKYINGLSDLSKEKQILFNNPDKTEVSNVIIGPVKNNHCKVTFTYSGVKDGFFVNDLQGEVDVILNNGIVFNASVSAWDHWVKWAIIAFSIILVVISFIAIFAFIVKHKKGN